MGKDRLSTFARMEPAPVAHAIANSNEPEDGQAEALLDDGIRILRRHYKLAAAIFLVFTVPAGTYIMRQPSRYQAWARILVERSQEMNSVSQEPRSADQTSSDFQTQAQMLRSRFLVVRAIQKVKLWEDPEFAVHPALTKPSDAQVSASELVEAFVDRLSTTPEQGTRLLNVRFVSTNPTTAMNVVNALVQIHIDETEKAQFAESAEVVDWLSQRLAEQRKRLEASEAAQQAYVEKQGSVSLDGRQNIIAQKLADLNAAVTRAKTDRMAKQTLYDQLNSVQQAIQNTVDSLPVVLSNPTLQQLRAHVAELKQKELTMAQDLGDRHPDLIKLRSEMTLADSRLQTELAKVIESMKSDFNAAQAFEDNLVRALEAQKREVLDLNRKGIEFSSLQRQATSDRQIYEKLLGQTQTRGITGKTSEWKIRIVESAELPRHPVSPQRTQQLLLALCGGLCLAIAAPFVREALDHRVKTPADIEKRLGLKCVAMVPIVKLDAGANGPLFTNEPTAFNEAFRRIRAAIFVRAEHSGPVRVLVTSAVPREGKSIVAVNLAIALAQMTQRVLLIDGDLRRPKVHKMLGIQPHPGFADVLSGEVPVREAMRPTHVPNLSVLACGLKRRSTAELLSGPQLEQILDELRESFDWIVFDSPPTGPVADACIIGRLVERAFLVIGAESTPVAAARTSVDQLKAAGIKIDGAILNRVDLQHSGYYYAPYYSGEYSDYLSKPAVSDKRRT